MHYTVTSLQLMDTFDVLLGPNQNCVASWPARLHNKISTAWVQRNCMPRALYKISEKIGRITQAVVLRSNFYQKGVAKQFRMVVKKI